MKLQLQGTRLKAFGMVLGALFVPFFVAAAVETVLGVGFVPASILAGVLWLLATIGLGLHFGTWRALFLAVVPGLASLLWTIILLVSLGPVEYIEARYALAIEGIVALIWLVGIAVGVLLRKVVFRPSRLFP